MRYLVTGQQAAEIDRYTINEIGVPQLVLMERASLAVAETVEQLIRNKETERILVIAESGNNGGDGVAAARILHQRGYRVELRLLRGISRETEAYLKQLALAEQAGVSFSEGWVGWNESDEWEDAEKMLTELGSCRVIVDAIFGVGLTREVGGIQKEAVEAINEARKRSEDLVVVSVDIPTGISSESGQVLGCAVRADVTVTFGYEKIGMRFAKDHCGEVQVREIGFFLPVGFLDISFGGGRTCYTYDPDDIKGKLPRRSAEANKGSFGQVLVIAGSRDMSGAAYLAAEAAYRMGSGLVKVVTHETNRASLQQLLPEAVLLTYPEPVTSEEFGKAFLASLSRASVVILGPGIGQSGTALWLVEAAMKLATCPVIADADALNLLSRHTEILEASAGVRPLILTPHMMEMARLVEKNPDPGREAVERLRENRLQIVEEMSEKYKAAVVLKDACTVVAADNIYLNSSGNAAMAKGGSGDVLTGVIAGLIAQGVPWTDAARLGVYIHGRAGDAARDRLGDYSVLARDLIDALPEVLVECSARS